MKFIKQAFLVTLFMASAFAPQAFAHSPAELGGSFFEILTHQLVSWHHLLGMIFIFATGAVAVIRIRARCKSQRQTLRSYWKKMPK